MLRSRIETLEADRAELLMSAWEEYSSALPDDITALLTGNRGIIRSFACSYAVANRDDPFNKLIEDNSTVRINTMFALENGHLKFVIWGEDEFRNRTTSHFLLDSPLIASVELPEPIDRDIEQEDGLSRQITDVDAIAGVNDWVNHITSSGGISSSCFQTPHGPLRGFCSDKNHLAAALSNMTESADEMCFYLCLHPNVDDASMHNIGLIWAGNINGQNLNGYYDRASPCPNIC